MNTADLLAALTARGVVLEAEDGRLKVRAAKGVIDEALRDRIAAHKDALLAQVIERDDPHAPFPLTDIQQAYLVGRTPGWPLGEIACHACTAFEGPALDPARMERAWHAVVRRHPAMRLRITDDGRQRVLPALPPWSMPVHDLRDAAPDVIAAHVEATWARLVRRNADPRAEHLFAIEVTLLPGGRMRTDTDFDMIACDASGIGVLLAEWGALYHDPDAALPPPVTTFREAVFEERARRATPAWQAHAAYWLERLPALPPAPELPLARSPEATSGMVTDRRERRLSPATTAALFERGRGHGLTPTHIVGAIFGEVLATWSSGRAFTLDLTLFRPPPTAIGAGPLVGEFTSTVLLAVDPEPARFVDRARALRDRLAADLEHVECSGVAAVRAHARQSGVTRHFPVVFTSMLNDRGGSVWEAALWLGERVARVTQTPQCWIDHQAYIEGGALWLAWDVPRGLFPAGLIEDAFTAEIALCERLAHDEAAWTSARFDLLPAAQRARRAAYDASDGPVVEGRLFDGFRAMAEAHPERIAVIDEEGALDYGAIEARANRITDALVEHRPAPGDPIVVCLPRGAWQVAAVLGVHGAGAAYVPLDADWPAARIVDLCARCGAAVVVTDAHLARLEWPAGVAVVTVEATETRPATRRPAPQGPHDRAYIIHTSGSTGAPKGVVMAHAATLATIDDLNRRYALGPDDRVLSLSSLAFDLSVYDIFGFLAAGGAVVLPPPDRARDVHHWMSLLDLTGVTVWSTVPALFELLVEAVERRCRRGEPAPGALRVIMLSGDWIPVDLPARARALWPKARIYGFGGATEAAIWSTIEPIEALDPAATSVPYGKPLTNQRMYALDRWLRPCPEWVPGELYIGGVGLADGYWREPALTAARFVTHPETGERLYRSGDQGRFLPSGDLEFLGRLDSQVKVGGVRVELGEVEAALRALPGVRDAVVDAPGDRHARQLVAWIVPEDPDAPPDPEALRTALAAKLPAPIVPRHYRPLAAAPLNTNGKVDRSRLPAFAPAAAPAAAAATDDGALGRVLTVIGEVMPGLSLGPDDDLVRAGANSVDLIRLGARLNDVFGHRPPMVEMLRQGSPAALARFYAAAAPTHAPEEGPALIIEPAARAAHKAKQLGLRPISGPTRALHRPPPRLTDYLDRQSQRAFAAAPIAAEALGAWLAALCPIELDGRLHHRHASAGDTRPLRTYLCARPDAVAGLPAGAWYHDPIEHRLAPVGPGRPITPAMHAPSNRPWVEAAPLIVCFVAARAAIEPLYGPSWRDFALIETGARAQLLEGHALACGLGVCQLGDLDRAAVGAVLGLAADEVLLHAMAAGGALIDDEAL
ncbi:MAG: amino acid adenylation domain-containing protein [Myxococcales bacterium]|nr:amino acid adenylation domain-containing protein [Myxococcales bacterium]